MLLTLFLAAPLVAPAPVVGPGLSTASSHSVLHRTTAPTAARVSGSKVEEVTFVTRDKITISADYYPPRSKDDRAPAALLVHDADSDRSQLTKVAERLRKQGFGVLAIDLRGHGKSPLGDKPWQELDEETQRKTWAFSQRDLEAAATWIRDNKDLHSTNLNLVGVGSGAALAVKHAVSDGNVRSVVLIEPPEKALGFDLLGDLPELEGLPVIVVASKKNQEQAEALIASAHSQSGLPWIELELIGRTGDVLDDKSTPRDVSSWMGDKAQPKRGGSSGRGVRGN